MRQFDGPAPGTQAADVPSSTLALSARAIADTLRELGATHLLGIPDNGSAALFDLLAREAPPRLVTVTREGEAFGVASGLWMGGASPVVAIQNTGLLESGDGLRGTAVRMGVPLVCLVGYRGYAKMLRAGIDPADLPLDPATLRRSDVDSVALFTEPTLRAWAVPFRILEPGEEAQTITAAWRQAHGEERPVALLMTAPTR